MADVSEKLSNDQLKFAQSVSKAVDKFIEALLEYLEKNDEFAAHRALAQWIKSGQGVSMYTARGDCGVELQQELAKNKIPFIVMDAANGRKCFIIRDIDTTKCQQINREILTAKGNYFQEVTGLELDNAIAKAEKITNKDIITIDGLSKEEAEVLKHKCNNIAKGFMVGIDEIDGLYRLSVHAPKLINTNSEKDDLCKAYTQTMLSLYGPNGAVKKAQLESDALIEENIAKYKGTENHIYIIGAHDPNQLIEINHNGFEYFNISVVNGVVQEKPIARYDKNDVNYESELQRYLDRIYDKTIVENYTEIQEHLQGMEQAISSNRPEKSIEQSLVSSAERDLADGLDKMIKENPVLIDNFNSLSYSEKMELYQNETVKLMTCLENGVAPNGYSQETFSALRENLITKKMDFSRYTSAIEKIKDCCINSHKAERHIVYKDNERTTKMTYER